MLLSVVKGALDALAGLGSQKDTNPGKHLRGSLPVEDHPRPGRESQRARRGKMSPRVPSPRPSLALAIAANSENLPSLPLAIVANSENLPPPPSFGCSSAPDGHSKKRRRRECWIYVPEDELFKAPVTRIEKISHFFHHSKVPDDVPPLPAFRVPISDLKSSSDYVDPVAAHIALCSELAPTSRAEWAFLHWYQIECAPKSSSSKRRKGVVHRKPPADLIPKKQKDGSAVKSYRDKVAETRQNLPPRSSTPKSTSSSSGSGNIRRAVNVRQPDTWRKVVRVDADESVIWLQLRGSRLPLVSTQETKDLMERGELLCGLQSESAPCLRVPDDIVERPGWRLTPILKKHLLALPEPFPAVQPFSLPQHIIRAASFHRQKKEDDWSRINKNRYPSNWKHAKPTRQACECPKGSKCDDMCLNRCLLIECDPSACPAGETCTNHRFQKCQWLECLEEFDTGLRGKGLRATAKISRGSFILEYTGEVISATECRERMEQRYAERRHFYFLEMGDGYIIDGTRKGSIARYINHSCSPNCHVEVWKVDGSEKVGIFASEDIEPGTELTYDYNFSAFNEGQRQFCFCGSSECCGMLGERRDTYYGVVWRSLSEKRKQVNNALKEVMSRKEVVTCSNVFLIRNLRKLAQMQNAKSKKNSKAPTKKSKA